MKICIKCHENKHESDFAVHHEHGTTTLRNVCKECYRKSRNNKHLTSEEARKDKKQDVVSMLLDACDYNVSNIWSISKSDFLRKFHVNEDIKDFNNLRKEARERLEDLGYINPENFDFTSDGDYLVIGDTFGKHTSSKKFNLIKQMASFLEVKAVIVIGFNTDDYNDVSNKFYEFDKPVYFIPIKNELKDIHTFCKGHDNLHIVLDSITIGDVTIRNQDYITPYVKTPLTNIDDRLYPGKCIVNCTRHEYFTRTSTFHHSCICSPGAMAEPHVIRTRYKLLLMSGKRIDLAPVDRNSFVKYRKNDIDKNLWECGCIMVNKNGKKSTINMIRIDPDNCMCVYDNTKITANSCSSIQPEFSILADLHAPYVDDEKMNKTYYKLEQYNPKRIIINGDLLDCRSFNPHNPNEAMRADFEQELTEACDIVSKLVDKAEAVDILWGNHEAFADRMLEKFPQFTNFMLKAIIDRISETGANIVSVNKNEVLAINDKLSITHGSIKFFGAGGGSQLDKLSKGLSKFVCSGHLHSPAIRTGVYSAGCLCNKDQGYNNSITSNWDHSFLNVYIVDGFPFVQQILL